MTSVLLREKKRRERERKRRFETKTMWRRRETLGGMSQDCQTATRN
jgi:hypothetical protein